MTYADVIVDITAKALDRPFQYLVPEDLEPEVEEGTIVEAPFGNGNRKFSAALPAENTAAAAQGAVSVRTGKTAVQRQFIDLFSKGIPQIAVQAPVMIHFSVER